MKGTFLRPFQVSVSSVSVSYIGAPCSNSLAVAWMPRPAEQQRAGTEVHLASHMYLALASFGAYIHEEAFSVYRNSSHKSSLHSCVLPSIL